MVKVEQVDLVALLNDTKKEVDLESVKASGKAEMLDILINYLTSNNLKVIKEVEVEEVDDDVATQAGVKTED